VRPTLGVSVLVALAAVRAPGRDVAAEEERAPESAEARLRSTVEFLASPDLAGRKAPEDRAKAARWIAARMKAAGLVPLPGKDSMVVPFPSAGEKSEIPPGENVVGWLPGTTPDHVILSAHYDHLGRKAVAGGETAVHPGADDNASGVAAMLECARTLAAGPKPRRSIAFVAFDLEEGESWSKGPAGSMAWVESPPVPLERLAAFVTADMLGRSLADAYPGMLLVMGSERAHALEWTVSRLEVPEGFEIHRLGMDFNSLGWSDYLPFEKARIPCLFFTTGACVDYHRPGDTADKIDTPRLAVHARLLCDAVRTLANLPDQGVWGVPGRPVWREVPEPRLDEAESVLSIVTRAEGMAETWGIPEAQRGMLAMFRGMLEGFVAKGKVTRGERLAMRMGALRLFAEAQKARPR
jgi:hypothetical protein